MRRRRPERRQIHPDPVYKDLLVAKFVNNLMMDGKKSIAEKIFYGALENIELQTKTKDGLAIFKKAIENVAPVLEVKSKRIGGATYQVPVEVKPARRLSLGIRWLVDAAKSRSGMSIRRKLYQELLDASNGEGVAVKKKEDTHRMAEANRAFAHYRW